MGHVARAPWDMLRGLHGSMGHVASSMGHVARAPWDMLRGLHGTCREGSMGHVARAPWDMFPWDMLRGLHGTCCEGSMGHVARAPWDMLQGFRGTFYDSKLVTRLQSVPRIFRLKVSHLARRKHIAGLHQNKTQFKCEL